MRYIAILIFIFFNQTVQATSLRIILRYDDYSRHSDTSVERALFDVTKNIGGGVLVGVIPFPKAPYPELGSKPLAADLDERKIGLLKKYASQGVIEISVHGYSHKSNTKEGLRSEFTGLSKNIQDLLLRNAKASLEAITGQGITSFIPPYNNYDLQTLQSLENNGYKLISAASGGPKASAGNLSYLPGGLYPQKINEVVASALSHGHTDAIAVVVIHPYDIVESGEKIPKFRRDPQISIHELTKNLYQINQYDNVHFMSLHELLGGDEDLSVERLQENLKLKNSLITRHRLLPEVSNLYPLEGLYYSQDRAQRMYQYQLYLSILLYGVLFLVILFFTQFVISYFYERIRYIVLISYTFSIGSSVILLAKAFFSGFYIALALALTCCLGVLVGTMTKQFRK